MKRRTRLRHSLAALFVGLLFAWPAAAQAQQIVSSEISVSPREARLVLELAGAASRTFSLANGAVLIDGSQVGRYEAGGPLDRAWRTLLGEAMEAEGPALAELLTAWSPPRGPGANAFTAAFANIATAAREPVTAAAPPAPGRQDTVVRLEQRIQELERRLQERERRATAAASRAQPRRDTWRPVRYVMNGLGGMISVAVSWLILMMIGAGVVLAGRRNLENVADTARVSALRAWLVGLAGTFLLLPAYILGIIALAISIVGIPLILVWAPLFPVAAVLAVIFGYVAIAHATGEAFAERRFQGIDWFRHGNSFYYIGTGLALLLALFFFSQFVQMGGPWLGFLHGLLVFLAVTLTWIVGTIGFGAFLLSRAGTRPPSEPAVAAPPSDSLFEEETHV
jgi:hypothetical protein